MPELLEAARQRFEVNAAEQDVQLKLELQQPLPTLMLDRQQIERVLDNLLSNALRHTPRGGEVRLLARHHGERLILSVEDNGEGIPYSQQARIFEPFVQIGRRRGGPDWGLPYARKLLSCMVAALACTRGSATALSSTWRCRSDGAPSRNLPCRV